MDTSGVGVNANAWRVVGGADEFYAGGFEGILDFMKRAGVCTGYTRLSFN